MSELKLKIKKCALVRKTDEGKKTGYYGKVITNGKAGFDEIARESAKNTTLHPKEASLAAELLLEGVCEKLKQGYIVELGPLGTLYPAVSGKWEEDPEDLKLADMTPKVNYKGSDSIVAAIKGASLSWATEKDEKEGTETPGDGTGDIINGGTGTGENTNTGTGDEGGTTPPPIDIEG
jgi:hypothetical protein